MKGAFSRSANQNNNMNIKEANKHFNKLSSFYTSISSDGDINQIELDLLKSYVVKFYESLTAGTVDTTAAPSSKPSHVAKTTTPAVSTAPPPAPPVQAVPRETGNAVSDPAKPKTTSMNSEMKSLFAIQEGKEISDKLSTTPIKDIGKSMSINEKIFTIQELFGGNQGDFDKVVSKLNGLGSYKEAQEYLASDVVKQNSWLDEEKLKKAKTFLKLVHRKYV